MSREHSNNLLLYNVEIENLQFTTDFDHLIKINSGKRKDEIDHNSHYADHYALTGHSDRTWIRTRTKYG